MRTIFKNDEARLIAKCISSIGLPIDITKYKRRVKYVQLTIAEGPVNADVIARVSPPVSVDQIREALA